MSRTVDHPDEVGPRRLLAALAVQGAPRPDVATVVEALRTVLEDVVIPSLGDVELTWQTSLVTRADDLERHAPPGRAGRAWSAARAVAADQFEAIGVEGILASLPVIPPDPRRAPIRALARFPTVAWGPVTVTVSTHEWMFPGGIVPRDHVEALTSWLLATAERLDAQTGYISLDHVDAFHMMSAWEWAVGAPIADRDVTRTVWGYGWATLLSADHVDALGGAAVLCALPGAVVVEAVGSTLVLLGDDPGSVNPAQIAALREALRPVLPEGTRSLEEFVAGPRRPFEAPRPPFVL